MIEISELSIEETAHRAASLTKQLLAFGRRQMLQLEAIDLILAATEPAVWQDCATEATIANAFMAGGQLLLTGDMTAEDVMASVQTAAAALK